jgi:hypothetical protein
MPEAARRTNAMPAQIYRQDKLLFVPRGADLSHACLVCAQPTVGPPIKRHLPASRWLSRQSSALTASWLMLVWDMVAFLISSIWWLVDARDRRERVVLFGLCAKHRQKYLLCRWSGWIGGILGTAAFVVAIFNEHLPDWLNSVLIGIGVAGLMTAFFAPSSAPTLQLTGENPHGMWVRGAGRPFAEQYPTLPK